MVSLEDLKSEIKSYNYETLTGSDDSVAEECIKKAYIWVKAKLRRCLDVNFTDDEDNPDIEIINQAVLKRALYELYSYAENEGIAQDKKEDAIELLRAYFGDCVEDFENKESNQKPTPIVKVVKGRSDFEGF